MNEYYILRKGNHYYKIIKINSKEEVQEEITQEEFYELYLS